MNAPFPKTNDRATFSPREPAGYGRPGYEQYRRARWGLLALASYLAFALTMSAIPAEAAPAIPLSDIKGSHDHPMVSRYPGSVIAAYRQVDLDELTAAAGYDAERRVFKPKKLEGATTRITYIAPPNTSTYAVAKSYRRSLARAGFEIVYQGFEGIKRSRVQALLKHLYKNIISTKYGIHCLAEPGNRYDQSRYFLASRSGPNGAVHVIVYLGHSYTDSCLNGRDRFAVQVDIIEPGDSADVSVDASAVAETLRKSGHIAMYGIHFAHDSARVEPSSDAALRVIADVLRTQPKLKLRIVGHTDGSGDFRYNFELSQRRAEAIRAALIKRFGIAATRLTAHGVGPLAPLESNDHEQGRAKNRRVELVQVSTKR